MEFLFIELQKNNQPLYEQIYEQVRNKIADNELQPGDKLPSKRKLANFLEVSQTTIELAYAQLHAEGYIRSEARRGFFVEQIDELTPVSAPVALTETEETQKLPYLYDFSPGTIDTSEFPFATWRKYAKEIIDESYQDLLQLGHPQGDAELRSEIAHYIAHSRGVQCTPEQIIIGSGTEQLMALLLRMLGEQSLFAIENPGYLQMHPVFEHHHHPIVPIDVDQDGMIVEQLIQSEATAAFVTPSHQFPTGAVLSASRKAALLNWAYARKERFIIEDDYDSEFRYSGRPIPSLKSLDQHRKVIYMSTFSKAFMPSLRMAYMVLPPTLYETFKYDVIQYAATVPRFDQHIVARFMQNGHFARHLNRMRTVYKRKMQAVIETLDTFSPTLTFFGEHAGMHVMIQLDDDRSETQLVSLAKQQNIRIVGISQYYVQRAEQRPTFLLGFGGIPNEQIPKAIHSLLTCWEL